MKIKVKIYKSKIKINNAYPSGCKREVYDVSTNNF